MRMDYPSKLIALYGSLEWGLRDITFLSPFSFRCNHGEFLCRARNHEDAKIFVEWLEDERDDWYVVYIIPNKAGDNCVLFKSVDIAEMSNKWITFEWIAKKYKKKWRIDIQSTT